MTDLSVYALATLEDAKIHLGIPASNTEFDDLVKRFINAASGKIEKFCHRFLAQRTGIAEYHDGIANNRLLLDQWPATKPSELWIDCSSGFTDTERKLDAADYELDLSQSGEGVGVVLINRCFFPTGVRNIKVVYDGGYDIIPDELADACLWTVQFLYEMRNDQSINLETKGKNQENTTYRDDLPAYVKDILYAYQRVEWPSGRQVNTR